MRDSLAIYPIVDSLPPAESYDAPAGFVASDTLLSTALVDSIGFLPDAAIADSPAADTSAYLGSAEGLPPMALTHGYSHSTALSALIAGTLVFAAINAPGLARALKSYKAELWNVRRRPNVFDDERSVSLPMAVLSALVFVVFGGIVLYNYPALPAAPTTAGVAAAMALLGLYCIIQRLMYRWVAFTFATAEQGARWLGGYDATQAFAGIGLIIPAVLLVYRPEWHPILLIVSFSIYGLLHIIFIIKGIRIFYHKINSLLYFILYLCTLELIPLMLLLHLATLLSEIL